MQKITPEELIRSVRFNADGLVPVIAQQYDTGEVLMMAWANETALKETLQTRRMCYFPVPANNCGAKAKHRDIRKN